MVCLKSLNYTLDNIFVHRLSLNLSVLHTLLKREKEFVVCKQLVSTKQFAVCYRCYATEQLRISVPVTAPVMVGEEGTLSPFKSIASVQCLTGTLLTRLLGSDIERLTINDLDELICHLKEYRVAMDHSLRDPAVGVLLKIREYGTNIDMRRRARLALSLLGRIEPCKGKGLQVLSIDGGGLRGVIAIEILKKLEELCNREIFEMFDLIVGTSTGAMLALLLGLKQVSLDEALQLYYCLGEDIFRRNRVIGTGKLFFSHAFYDTENLERILKHEVGNDISMIDTSADKSTPKVAAVSTVVNHVVLQPYVFRNYCFPPSVKNAHLGSSKHQSWVALRASSAAPGYFEEMKIGSDIHQDGGLLANNPCAVAVHEAKCLWPSTPLQTVVSVGTGLYHGRAGPHTANFTSLRSKLMKVVASATDTEAVHTVMEDLMPPKTYFRFNPNLSIDVTFDEYRPQVLEQLQVDARNYIRKFDKKFKDAAKSLNKSKSLLTEAKETLFLEWTMRS